MCSDLKVASLIPNCNFSISLITFDQHLYVAVTRARIQLFFVETNETAIASVVKLLTQDLPEALVDITKKDHSNVSLVTYRCHPTERKQFLASLETLRPGTTNDPARWSLKAQQLMQQKAYKDVSHEGR